MVVVLCSMEKEEMELIIDDAKLDRKGTDIIVRSGSISSTQDLLKVSAPAARSIVVLSDRHKNDADSADVVMVRAVLTLRSINAPLHGHITAEVSDVDNEVSDETFFSRVKTYIPVHAHSHDQTLTHSHIHTLTTTRR